MALAAAGQDLDRKTIAYLTQSDITLESTTDYARLLLALSAAGQGPLFKNTNLADKIVSLQQKDGQFGQPQLGEAGFINTHLWSILALNSAGYDISNRELAKNWLTARQNADGGFGWAEGVASDSDDTAIAIQTLIVLGDKAGTSPVLKKALDYLKSCQEEDGGFTSGNDWMSSGSNASSTAWILQALTAAGQNLSTEWVKGGNGPASYLVSLQGSTGFYNWKTGVTATPVSTTAQTIMALSHKPFPVNVDLGRSPSQPQSVPDQGGRFSDLKSNYWAYEPIISLVEAGILAAIRIIPLGRKRR
jgi:hypothetical protein